MAAQDCQKTTIKPNNKLLDLRPADPFIQTDPKFNQVVPRSLHTFPENFMQIAVQPFSRNVADKETNKERNRSITIPRPSTGGGVNILTVGIFNSFGLYDQVK